MIKKIGFIILLVLISLIALYQLIGYHAKEPKEFFQINDQINQEIFKEKLEEINVNFEIDSQNRVWYDPKFRDEVHKLAFLLVGSNRSTYMSFRYDDNRYNEQFEQRLEEEGVVYEWVLVKDIKHLRLRWNDVKKWKPIKDSIDAKVISEARGGL